MKGKVDELGIMLRSIIKEKYLRHGLILPMTIKVAFYQWFFISPPVMIYYLEIMYKILKKITFYGFILKWLRFVGGLFWGFLIFFGRRHAAPNFIIPSTQICRFENIFNFEGITCRNFKHADIKSRECQNKSKLIISSGSNNRREQASLKIEQN